MSSPVNDQTILQKASQDPELAAALKKAGIEVPLPQFIRCEPGTLCSRNSKPFDSCVLVVSKDSGHWVARLDETQNPSYQIHLNPNYIWQLENGQFLKATLKPEIS